MQGCKMAMGNILLLIVLLPSCTGVVPVDEFFPFGVENGDTTMVRSDDGSSPKLPLSIGFPFFDYLHDALWVNVNGAISFLTAISTYTPVCTPVQQNFRMIAPYWCDIDIRSTGDIFYRESFDPIVLQKAALEVSSAFPDSRNIQLKWAYVITWWNVTFFPDTFAPRPRNTFQGVLTTDGVQSFVIFYYNNMTWTTGTYTGGNSSGLGGTPAKAGFDAGDSRTLFMIPGSCSSDIVTIGQRSNVGSPGKWLFRVDNSDIQSAGCSTNFTGNFRVAPSFVDSYGHVPIEITGPCVEASENATCRFYDPNGNITDVPAEQSGNQTSTKLFCSTPFFYSTGRLRLDLIISTNNGSQKQFTSFLYVITPPDADAGLKIDVQQALNDTDSLELTFTWNPEAFGVGRSSALVDIDLYVLNTVNEHEWAWQQVKKLANNYENSGTAKIFISRVTLYELLRGISPAIDWAKKFAFSVGQAFKRAKFNGFIQGVKLYGDVFSPSYREEKCNDWYKSDLGPPQGLPPCPPTTALANADNRFTRDDGCPPPPPCFFHPGVDFCIRSISASENGGGQQCCYIGDRIKLGPRGGGTADMSHSSRWAGLPHFINDVLPWIACCYKQNEELCNKYYDKRPSDPGTNYTPPRPAGASGDPHITTFDLLDYTFNGAGEFWMLKNSTVQPVAVQARMEQFFDGTVSKLATIFTAFVMKNAASSVIQIQKSTVRTVDVLVDGIAMDLTNPAIRSVPFEDAQVIVSDDLSSVSVTFSSGFSFLITTTSGAFALSASCDEQYKGDKTHGLLGVFNGDPGNDLQTPDGTIVPTNSSLEYIHYNFGMKWLVSPSESLFNYGTKQYSDYYFPNFHPNFDFDPSQASPDAQLLCGTQWACLYDYSTTGSSAIANQTKSFGEKFNDTVHLFSKNISLCPILQNPANGYCQVPNYFPPATAVFSCFEGYKIVGNNVLFCNDNYQWNGTAPVCTEEITSTSTSTVQTTTTSTTTTITPTTTITSTTQSTISPTTTIATTTTQGTSTSQDSTVQQNSTQAPASTTFSSTSNPAINTSTTTSKPDGASSLKTIHHLVSISIVLLLANTL